MASPVAALRDTGLVGQPVISRTECLGHERRQLAHTTIVAYVLAMSSELPQARWVGGDPKLTRVVCVCLQ